MEALQQDFGGVAGVRRVHAMQEMAQFVLKIDNDMEGMKRWLLGVSNGAIRPKMQPESTGGHTELPLPAC